MASQLVGIAKLAAQSPVLEAKSRVEYLEIPTRTYIGRCSSKRVPFDYTINPYRGCEFGCKYCYARYAHEFMELRDYRLFETRIFAKQWNEHAFRAELRKIRRGAVIGIGTATDPYQPAERRFGITRRMLNIMVAESGYTYFLTTKSDLVARDADLWASIGKRNRVRIGLTITTTDERLAAMTEPYAPRPYLRFAAIRKLVDAGIQVGVLGHPIMPLINDGEKALDRLMAAAADAGASYFSAAVLFLQPCAQAAFFPFLEEHYPHLVKRYRERFERSAFLRGDYPDMIRQRVQKLRLRYNLNRREIEYDAARLDDAGAQMNLFV